MRKRLVFQPRDFWAGNSARKVANSSWSLCLSHAIGSTQPVLSTPGLKIPSPNVTGALGAFCYLSGWCQGRLPRVSPHCRAWLLFHQACCTHPGSRPTPHASGFCWRSIAPQCISQLPPCNKHKTSGLYGDGHVVSLTPAWEGDGAASNHWWTVMRSATRSEDIVSAQRIQSPCQLPPRRRLNRPRATRTVTMTPSASHREASENPLTSPGLGILV